MSKFAICAGLLLAWALCRSAPVRANDDDLADLDSLDKAYADFGELVLANATRLIKDAKSIYDTGMLELIRNESVAGSLDNIDSQANQRGAVVMAYIGQVWSETVDRLRTERVEAKDKHMEVTSRPGLERCHGELLTMRTYFDDGIGKAEMLRAWIMAELPIMHDLGMQRMRAASEAYQRSPADFDRLNEEFVQAPQAAVAQCVDAMERIAHLIYWCWKDYVRETIGDLAYRDCIRYANTDQPSWIWIDSGPVLPL